MKPSLQLPSATLRPAVGQDLDAFCRLLWDADVRRYLCDDIVFPRDTVEAMLAAGIALEGRQLGIWFIESPAGELIGHGALQPSAHAALAGSIELGIALQPGYWGRGLAAAVVHALAEHARAQCGLDRIVAAVDAPNARSHRLLLRSGFARIGETPGPKHVLTLYERLLREPG